MPDTSTPIVHFVNYTNVFIPANRDRKEFKPEDILSLATSIEKVGLLHLPVVRIVKLTQHYTLVVGERRYRAMKMLIEGGKEFYCMGLPVPKGCIPVLFYEELDEKKAKEVELEENLRRVDLTWQEKNKALADLHAMLGGNTINTINVLKTSYNTNISTTNVNTAKLLVQYMHHHEVKTARTEKDAVKQMYKVVQRAIDIKLGQTAKPSCDFRLGDVIDEMEKIAYNTIDVICMDPPYGIDADKSDMHQFQGMVHQYKDKWEDVRALLVGVARLSFILSKQQAHLYMFCDITHFEELEGIFNGVGWSVWTRPIIWMKDAGIVPAIDYGPRRLYESILFANKGKKMVTGVYNDAVQFPLEADRKHAAQKPVALIRNLLQRSCRAGDTVLDPFCGSGTIFLAGNELKLTSIGIDNDPAMPAIIAKRLADGK